MTPTKQQTDQINSINPDILKLGEEALKLREPAIKRMISRGVIKIFFETHFNYVDMLESKLSGILSQCKSEVDFLEENDLKPFLKKLGHGIFQRRISALKETIKSLPKREGG